MIDTDSPTGYRCDNCGAFCGVVVEYRGPSLSEVESCVNCGTNVPECAHEDGTVTGCNNDATHEGSHKPNRVDRYWCDEHAPADAETLPYVEEGCATAENTSTGTERSEDAEEHIDDGGSER